MMELLFFPFRMLGSLIGLIFSFIGNVFGFVASLIGGVFGLVFGGAFFLLVIFGLAVLVRWIVRGVRGY